MFFKSLLSADTNGRPVADWISSSFPIIRTVLIILIALLALAIIVAILMQPSKPAGGNNVILGTNNDSYYSKHKAQSKEGRITKIIIFSAITILVLTLLYFASYIIYPAV